MLKENLEKLGIHISLKKYPAYDWSNGWEVKAIADNKDLFESFYNEYPLSCIQTMEDYYLYLLSRKFVAMRDVIPLLLLDEHKEILKKLSSDAEKALKAVVIGDVIKFINGHIEDIFSEDLLATNISDVTIELITDYAKGISDKVFSYLVETRKYIIIDNFDRLENVFEKKPFLFEALFPSVGYDDMDPFRFEDVLNIWRHILNREKSNLREHVEQIVGVLYEDIRHLADNSTMDDIIEMNRSSGSSTRFCKESIALGQMSFRNA